MSNPPPDGDENTIDIFIISADEPVPLQLKEHLEQRGYRITVFTSSVQLNDALPTGKPNLLICDSTTCRQEGFRVCSQIKADDDLWVIPVLMLTAASTMEDLLSVLESNTDNFIGPPYHLPDHLLLIDSMLTTPVERLTPDQIKKQFRVSHEDQTYVVAANRKKLLEYLLSAFEITVNTSKELLHVSSDLRELSESAKELERKVTEQTLAIETGTGMLRQKDQKIVTLTRKCEELEKALKQKTGEIGDLEHGREEDKILITARDETIRSMTREHEEAQSTYRSQNDELNTQISLLIGESDARKTSLDTMQHALIEESTHSASLEKTLHALTLEHEQQKSEFSAERDRALSAEQEFKSVLQAKMQSEQDLSRIITDLEEKVRQQAAGQDRLKGELEAETNHRVLLETQGVMLQQELEQAARSYHSEIGELHQKISKLDEALTASAAALEHETSITKTQKGHLEEVIEDKKNTDEKLASHSTRLAEAQATIASGEQERTSLEVTIQDLTSDKKNTDEKLASLLTRLAEAQATITSGEQERTSLEVTIQDLTAEMGKSEQAAQNLSVALRNAQSDIEAEKIARYSVEETLSRTTREHDNAYRLLRQGNDATQADLDSCKVTLAQRERDLELAETRNRALMEEQDLAAQHHASFGKQAHLAADELGPRQTPVEKTPDVNGQPEDPGERISGAHDDREPGGTDTPTNIRQFEEKTGSTEQIGQAPELYTNNPAVSVDEQPGEPQIQFESDGFTTTNEKVQLVNYKDPGLPVPVGHVNQSITSEITRKLKPHVVSGEDHPSGRPTGSNPHTLSDIIPGGPDISNAEGIPLKEDPTTKASLPLPGAVIADGRAEENTFAGYSPEKSPATDDDDIQPVASGDVQLQEEVAETIKKRSDDTVEDGGLSSVTPGKSGGLFPDGTIVFGHKQWLDLISWAHHSGALTQDQRLKIIRIGRLVHKGRKLTHRQQGQVDEILAFVYTLGYRSQ